MFDRYITFQARLQPHASAISTHRGDISFAKFEDEIASVANWIHTLSLRSTQPVAVQIADRYLHWLVLFALARNGVPSCSVDPGASNVTIERLAPQLFITDREQASKPCSSVFPICELSPQIAKSMIASAERLRLGKHVDGNRLARVATSSGTTGEAKAIGFSWFQIEARFPSFLRAAPQLMTRMLALVGPEMGGFEASLCTWACGGTVVFGPRTPGELAELLPRLAPSALAGAPIQLQAILSALPKGSLPMPNMGVCLFGAHSPADLKREIGLRLSCHSFNLYGSTEAGLMAWASLGRLAEPTAVGFIPPWVDLEIVDHQDHPCAAGEAGVLRVRGPGVAAEYLHDRTATAAHFRQGWFYPGDAGLLTGDGCLHLHGRTTDVLNLGGDKVLPSTAEDAVRSCPGVKDAAAFMAPGRDGVEGPWMAIVASGPVDRMQISAALRKVGAAAMSIAWLPAIPRNPRGKVIREALRSSVASRPLSDPPSSS